MLSKVTESISVRRNRSLIVILKPGAKNYTLQTKD